MMKKQVVEVRDLVVQRGRVRAIDGLSFSTAPGQVTGLLGPSGCGKSTLMRSLVGVQVVTSGTVEVLGLPAGDRRLRDRVGYVTQAPSVYDDLTVAENLRFFARVLGVDAAEADRCVEVVDLAGARGQLVGRLSGGQRSRVSLAVALLGDPEVLVLDEPTVGLDPVLRRDLWAMFHALADRGTTVLVSSHVMDEAERCDRLLLMRDGRAARRRDPGGPARAHRDGRRGGGVPAPGGAGGGGMTGRITLAIASRVLTQLRRDRRTLAMLVVLPCLVLTLLWWMFEGGVSLGIGFNALGPPLLALIPFIVMFLVTSVTTLRERSSGTLERLLAMPTGKGDFLGGYALAFGLVAAVQSTLAVLLSVSLLGLEVSGPVWMLVVVAVADAVLGSALGLFVSAFARTEFQAVQFMPLLVIPQILLCGLFLPRPAMPPVLEAISNLLPLSYAVDAMASVSGTVSSAFGGVDASVWRDLAVVAGFAVAALALGAATLRRRTP